MDLLALDERLEKDMKHLEKNLVEYEKLMSEISALKYTFENQTKKLMAAYEEKWKAIQIQNDNNLFDLEGRVSEKISDEIYKSLGKNRAIEVGIEAINTDMCRLKSDSEKSLINLSAELFKETTRAEDKDRKLAKNFKIFMVISSALFIILLIWR